MKNILFRLFLLFIISTVAGNCYAQDTLRLSSQSEVDSIFEQLNTKQNVVLLVAPGVYWLDDPDDSQIRMNDNGKGTPYAKIITTPEIRIIGTDSNPENTIFAVNRGQTQGAIGNFTMLLFRSRRIYTENITYGNYCNVDLVYPRNPSLNREKRNTAIVQAQLAHCWGTDTIMARNCQFISRLNMNNFTGARYAEFHNCYMECTDDALAGNSLYKNCKLTFFSSKPFYATGQGATFDDCDIYLLTHGTQYFTKATSPVSLINTRLHCDHDIRLAWCKDNDPSICHAENVTLNRKPAEFDSSYHKFVLEKKKLYNYGQQEIVNGNRWTFSAFETADTRFYDWHIDTTVPVWYYGNACDGAEGHEGYVQDQKGARLIISPCNSKKTFKGISFTACPCKSAGQGFGSALGQYMDICIGMDVEKLNGWGLRIQRTPDYDHAVEVKLIEYNNGKVTAISKAEKCELFLSECHISVKYSGKKLSAVITHEGKEQMLSLDGVNLNKGDIMIQHTGSVGASACLIKDIEPF